MLRRFLKSRGWSKLRRNRMAMVSLVVIALYGLLALYIVAAQFVNDEVTSLRGTPAGVFLRQETLTRVGPEKLGGLGIRQEPELRVVQYGWYIEELGRVLIDVDRLDPQDTEGQRAVLARSAMAERRLADIPLDRLRELYRQGEELLKERDALSIRRNTLRNIGIRADSIAAAARALRAIDPESPDAAAQFDKLRDDAAFAIEDFVFIVEDYQKLDPDGKLGEVDTAPLLDAVDALQAAEAPASLAEPVYPNEQVERITELAESDTADVTQDMEAVIGRITPVVNQIYPQPEGFGGLVYRFKTLLGTDRQGRSIMVRALYSAKVAIQVGFVTAVISVLIGSVLGAAAAFLGGWVDHAVNWLFSVLSSIPHLVLLVVIAFMFTGSAVDGTLIPVYAAFCLTFWIGPCRVVRGEAMKLKELEFVQAATAIGFGRFYILLKHLIPNTLHLMFISFSLLFIAAIKSEVILTFLGLGLKDGASWGIMISQSKPEVVSGFFWQIGSATFFMFVLVLAFNILSDALQDAFDPKHVG